MLVCHLVVCTPLLPKSPLPAHNYTKNRHPTPLLVPPSRNTSLGPHWFNCDPKRCMYGKVSARTVTYFVCSFNATPLPGFRPPGTTDRPTDHPTPPSYPQAHQYRTCPRLTHPISPLLTPPRPLTCHFWAHTLHTQQHTPAGLVNEE